MRFWEISDFPDLDARAADTALLRLKAQGELVAIRRGLYYRGKKWPWGMSRPSTNEVVARVAGDGVGPAGLTAANELGLTTQLAGRETYAVPGPAPRPLATTKFVSRTGRTARARARLRPTEVALLEVLDSWTEVLEVSPSEAVAELAELLKSSAVRPAKLVAGAADEPPAARERLKFTLRAAALGNLADLVNGAVAASTREKALADLVVA